MRVVRSGVLEGPCRIEQVLDYLESLARQAGGVGFHRSGRLGARTAGWKRIPAPIQPAGAWRRTEGFLMPKLDINLKGIYV